MVTAETQKFSAPIGHERRWDALVNAFQKGMVPQTLLLSGPRHVGKTLLVKRFAQLLMCPNVDITSTRSVPCLACKTCHQIEIETFPDFKLYRPIISASKEGAVTAPENLDSSVFVIDQARAFRNEAMYRPTVGARKVMVIAQADRMNVPAQQALLKTFEEPIEGVNIVLLCEGNGTLLPTILSRCWQLPLALTTDRVIRSWLLEMNAEKNHIEEAVRVARGLPGAAWREIQRLKLPDVSLQTRTAQVDTIVNRILKSEPAGALALTEIATSTADVWGQEDEKIALQFEKYETKDMSKKLTRSRAASFLDELSYAYWRRWTNAANATQNATSRTRSMGVDEAEPWARGLDQIRKTRH